MFLLKTNTPMPNNLTVKVGNTTEPNLQKSAQNNVSGM